MARGNPRIGEYAKQGNLARLAKTPGSQLTTAATAASPADPEYWRRKVREEFPDASASDVDNMAAARKSQYYRDLAAKRHRKAG